jgi:hypothetical protein
MTIDEVIEQFAVTRRQQVKTVLEFAARSLTPTDRER